jgi:hypothetical protein
MWAWEGHVKHTMSVERMPTHPSMYVRSASIFGFRPSSPRNSDQGDDDNSLIDSVKTIVPKGLTSVFDSIESGALNTMSGISSGADFATSGLTRGIGHLVDGTENIFESTLDFIPGLGDDDDEDFEARSDSFCEYMQDDDADDSEEDENEGDVNKTWKSSVSKNVTMELNSKMVAVSICIAALAVVLILFVSHAAIFDLGKQQTRTPNSYDNF